MILEKFPYILTKTPTAGGGTIFSKWFDIRLAKKFFLVAGSIAGAALFFSITAVIVLLARNIDISPPPLVIEAHPSPEDGYEDDAALPVIIPDDDGSILRPPARTNFLFVGLDRQMLADAIMVGTFYRDTGDIHLMSIPRDMYTVIPNHRMEQMREHGLRPRSTLKINEMRAFGGRAQGMYYMQAQLGEMLGIKTWVDGELRFGFDYYVEVELSAFRRIVDAIDGVEVYVPRHFFYEDPEQNLFINIPRGLQTLDGNMAEGFVRFRQFPMGDLERNNMQMEFMSQLIRQVLTREAIMNNPIELIRIVLEDVSSDFGMLDVPRYLRYIGNINADSVSTFTMPGAGRYIGDVSWFMPDANLLPGVVSQVFFADLEPLNDDGFVERPE